MERKTTLLVLALASFGWSLVAQEELNTDIAQSDQTETKDVDQIIHTEAQGFAQSELFNINSSIIPKTDLITELAFDPAFASEADFSPTLYDDHFNNWLLNPTFGNEPAATVEIDPVSDAEVSAGRAHLRKLIYSSGLLFMSGFCDATSEVLKIKYGSFERVFPKANDQFWDYNISWTNKYHNGTPPDARFMGSKTALVWTTDGYHLMRMIRNCTMIVAVTIPLKAGFHRSWKSYLKDGVIYYLSYTAGFNLAYDVVFE